MDQDADRELRQEATPRVGLLIGLVLGGPVMLVGIVGLLHHTDATPPSSYFRFFIGGDLIHDFVVAPIAAAIAFLLLRRTPLVARAPLRAALFGTAVVIAIGWPGIRMYGRMRAPDNATVQPLNYATAVATAVAVVWVIAGLWLLAARMIERRASRSVSQAVPSRDP
jgi:hypothetical protein